MRGDGEGTQRTARGRWGRRPAPPAGAEFRSVAEIRAQYEAARAFAGEVTGMAPTSHQYTAGQAAALAWLLGDGPAPLTYQAMAEAEPASPQSVLRLAERTRELMAGTERGGLFPQAYVLGVDYVCHWVQGHTDRTPIPGPPE